MNMCPPEHKHNQTGTCYTIHKCRCAPCKEHNAAAERHRSRMKAYGRYDNGLVDAAPAREHIRYLQTFGYGYRRIAELSGVGNTAIESLLYGRKGVAGDPRFGEALKRITRTKADKILAVHPTISTLAGGTRISSRGTQRRIQALARVGWSMSKQADIIGMEPTNLHRILHNTTVTVTTHRAVETMFTELWNQTPERVTQWDQTAYTRTVNFAKRHKWVSPLAWDDIDNDPAPPVAEQLTAVDDMAVELAVSGHPVRLRTEERLEAVRRLHAMRWSDTRIAERLGYTSRTVMRDRQTLGLEAFEYSDLVMAGAA